MTHRRWRTAILGALLALTALGAPAVAAKEGIHLARGAADEKGCFALEVRNGDTVVKTIPADDGFDDGGCATRTVYRSLPNGILLFGWMRHTDTGLFTCCWVTTTFWGSDGTTAGTVPLASFIGPSGRLPLWQVIGRAAYISHVLLPDRYSGEGDRGTLTMTRGTPATTHTVQRPDVEWPAEGVAVFPFYKLVHGRVLFSAPARPFDEGSLQGREVWVTNGSRAGTRMVKDIYPGPVGSDPRLFDVAGGRLGFTANDGNGRAWWTTDGTRAGTRKAARH